MSTTDKRVTTDNLRFFVPLWKSGDEAEDLLESDREFSHSEKAELLSRVGLKKLAYDKFTELTYPLMRKEIQKVIRTSHLKREEDEIFPVIYQAGLGGMERGLRKFDVDKIEGSPTNYLFMWIMVYAKKELLSLEAPMGIKPSRFQKHKKIAAVRKRLSEALGRDATNEEILEYFHTGKADFKNYNGPKIKAAGTSEANKRITMELIEEQEDIEKNLNFAQIFDSSEDYRSERLLSTVDDTPFEETLMGAFLAGKRFEPQAVAVLKSELQQQTSAEEDAMLAALTVNKYRSVMKIWKNYLSDPAGDFRKFLEENGTQGFEEFDVSSMLKLMENQEPTKRPARPRYDSLFDSKER